MTDQDGITKWPLDNLAGWTGRASAGSINHTRGVAELTRRQLLAQIDASAAEQRAADAATKADDATLKGAVAQEKNATYMLWSVIIAAIAALFSAASAIATAVQLMSK
jgi:hypothetical protein